MAVPFCFEIESVRIAAIATQGLCITDMNFRIWAAGLAVAAAALLCGNAAKAQDQATSVLSLRGRVLNAVTNEPVARALVNLQGWNAATLTDDQGRFQFNIQMKSDPMNGEVVHRLGGRAVEVRKLGFIQNDRLPTTFPNLPANESTELTIRILPEAKIVGHIDVPGSEGDVRIQCQLYRKEIHEGRENWQPQQSFMNWVDGEVRFYGLRPGTYKLITHEQMDRDSPPAPGEQLYGYPPLYYPNTTDFSLASPIVVKAGETARVNLTVVRKAYFPVRINVENIPAGRRLNISVYPMGHPSPGWSLGYNPRDGTIEGILPDGDYTVEASTHGEGELSGRADFSVKGKPSDGPTLKLVPDATISVNVSEEFQSAPSNFGETQAVFDNPQSGARRFAHVNVSLIPLDDLDTSRRGSSSRTSEGSQGPVLIIPDVRPGRYQVEVNAESGYAASVQCGGKDLSRQPLMVGLGGEVPPIEVVLRDNGARVDGTLEEETGPGPAADPASMRFVYLLPTADGARPRNVQVWQGQFSVNELPPGSYLVVAFDQPQQDLPSGPGEAMQRLMRKGQVIRVESGQHLNLRVKVNGSELE
jgi:hypothetical protein